MTTLTLYQQLSLNNIEFLDLCFTDPLGEQKHITYHVNRIEQDFEKEGFAFDGSSVRLFEDINNSDLLLVPDISTTHIDPLAKRKTMRVICDIKNPDMSNYKRDPRCIAKNAVKYLRQHLGPQASTMFGVEPEFFLFNDISHHISPNGMYSSINATEAAWNCGEDKGNVIGYKEGYFATQPVDSTSDIRSEMLHVMEKMRIPTEKHHHEVGTCQVEIGFSCKPLVESADCLQICKYAIKNVAKKHEYVACFMPKVLYNDNGNGMHIHQSLWLDKNPLFYDQSNNLGIGECICDETQKYNYADLSDLALHYIAGIIHHSKSLAAFCNPTTNSYKRLQPGFEAPINIAYSKGNRSAAIRIPNYHGTNPKAKRMEYRAPDPTGNPYLVLAANLLAGLDGIKRKLLPGKPCDINLYKHACDVPVMPKSLDESLDALEKDNQYLIAGGFPESFLKDYIALKRKEVSYINSLPHPAEFGMYAAL